MVAGVGLRIHNDIQEENMQYDMHYCGTYAMGYAAGITADDAQVIATSAQLVDDNNFTELYKLSSGEGVANDPVYSQLYARKDVDSDGQARQMNILSAQAETADSSYKKRSYSHQKTLGYRTKRLLKCVNYRSNRALSSRSLCMAVHRGDSRIKSGCSPIKLGRER